MRNRVNLPNADGKVILFDTPGGGATHCLISAHGWFTAASPQTAMTAPISFYCEHGRTVDDLNSVKAWSRSRQVGPALAVGDVVTDYTLGKLQDSHKDVAAFMKMSNKGAPAHHRIDLNEAALEMWNMGCGETYAGIEQRFNKAGYDVATVRNRSWFKGGNTIRMSELIAIVHAHHPYTHYHAVFCREAR